jgi:hypothetical protein
MYDYIVRSYKYTVQNFFVPSNVGMYTYIIVYTYCGY